jgi:hypothetical protein
VRLAPLRPEHRKKQARRKAPSPIRVRREEEARYVEWAAENLARLRREFLERQGRAA